MYLTKNLNKVLFFAVVMLIKLLFYNNSDSLVVYPEYQYIVVSMNITRNKKKTGLHLLFSVIFFKRLNNKRVSSKITSITTFCLSA